MKISRSGSLDVGPGNESSEERAPGKRSPVQRKAALDEDATTAPRPLSEEGHLLSAALQRRDLAPGQAGGEEVGAAVGAAAALGTSEPGGRLPHGETIQRAFGRHDVGAVEAHVGDHASGGARAMGAEAFTMGRHVAFDSAPSLHTAAHEAAHVVQQRAGVHLKGDVGEADRAPPARRRPRWRDPAAAR